MGKVTHYASMDGATESDNTTYVYILCDPNDNLYDDPEYTNFDIYVTCKRCLKIMAKWEKEV